MPPRSRSRRTASAANRRTQKRNSPSPRRPQQSTVDVGPAAPAATAATKQPVRSGYGAASAHLSAAAAARVPKLPETPALMQAETYQKWQRSSAEAGKGSRSHSSSAPSSSATSVRWYDVLLSLVRSLLRSRKELVSIHEVDHFLQFNKYIRRGYRPSRLSPMEAFGSVFLYVHNESVNILTHVFFALVFLYLVFWPPIPPLFAGLYGVVSEEDLPGSAAAAGAAGVSENPFAFTRGPPVAEGASSRATFDALGRRKESEGDSARTMNAPSSDGTFVGRAKAVDPASTVAGNKASAFLSFEGQRDAQARTNAGQARGQGKPSHQTGLEERLASVYKSSDDNSHGGILTADRVRKTVHGAMLMPHRVWAAAAELFDVFPGNQQRHLHRQDALDAAVRRSLDPLYQVFFPVSLSFFFTFFFSIVYHTFMPCCATRRGYQQLLQCDVLGVLTSITGSVYVYLVRGNPCVSSSVLTMAILVMTVSTVCTLYALILSPLNLSLGGLCGLICGFFLDIVATCVLNLWEWLRDEPLPPPPTHSEGEDALLLLCFQCRRRFRRRLHEARQAISRVLDGQLPLPGKSGVPIGPYSPTTPTDGDSTQSTIPVHHRAAIALMHCLLHFACYLLIIVPKHSGSSSSSSGGGLTGFLGFLAFSAHGSSRASGEASGAVLSTASSASGYTQAVYYHGWSYLWLLVGGLLNATRQPERLLWAMTRRARAYERRRMELRGEASVAEEVRRSHPVGSTGRRRAGGSRSFASDSFSDAGDDAGEGGHGDTRGRPTATRVAPRQGRRTGNGCEEAAQRSSSGGSHLPGTSMRSVLLVFFPFLPQEYSWDSIREHLLVWWPAALCYFFTRYILSNRELDFIGNSHNLWHVMTGLSALCVMIGAYYDVVEWELMAPQC